MESLVTLISYGNYKNSIKVTTKVQCSLYSFR